MAFRSSAKRSARSFMWAAASRAPVRASGRNPPGSGRLPVMENGVMMSNIAFSVGCKTEWRRWRENCLSFTARPPQPCCPRPPCAATCGREGLTQNVAATCSRPIMPGGTLPAATGRYGSMGGFIAGGGHGPAGDGGPGISIQSELGVQAIANPLRIVECLCCGDRYVAVIQSSAF